MSAMAHSRGHVIVWDGRNWRLADDGSVDDGCRPCVSCGLPPTSEGYDACLGVLPGVTSACCGHGVEPPYVIR